jgi:hypothetical protein
MVAGSFDKFSSVTDIRFEQMNLPPNSHVYPLIVWVSTLQRSTAIFILGFGHHAYRFFTLCIFQFRLIGSSSFFYLFMRGFSSTMIAIYFALRTKLSNLGVMRACLFTLRLLLSETKKI